MVALVTGASSGIGRDIAIALAKRGYNLILVARRKDKLIKLKEKLGKVYGVKAAVIAKDLSDEHECFELYEKVKKLNIDVLVNNAGFGVYGRFDETELGKELEMLNVNIRAMHILTKLFYKDFRKRDSGYILNVASSAGFMAGPLLSSYYASKNYVVRLTQAIDAEIRESGSSVYIGMLCPGPVDTEFNETAGVAFGMSGLDSRYVAEYAVKCMFMRKMTIIPGIAMKIGVYGAKFAPQRLLSQIVMNLQKAKNKEN